MRVCVHLRVHLCVHRRVPMSAMPRGREDDHMRRSLATRQQRQAGERPTLTRCTQHAHHSTRTAVDGSAGDGQRSALPRARGAGQGKPVEPGLRRLHARERRVWRRCGRCMRVCLRASPRGRAPARSVRGSGPQRTDRGRCLLAPPLDCRRGSRTARHCGLQRLWPRRDRCLPCRSVGLLVGADLQGRSVSHAPHPQRPRPGSQTAYLWSAPCAGAEGHSSGTARLAPRLPLPSAATLLFRLGSRCLCHHIRHGAHVLPQSRHVASLHGLTTAPPRPLCSPKRCVLRLGSVKPR